MIFHQRMAFGCDDLSALETRRNLKIIGRCQVIKDAYDVSEFDVVVSADQDSSGVKSQFERSGWSILSVFEVEHQIDSVHS